QRRGIARQQSGPLHEGLSKRRLVDVELNPPLADTNDHSVADLLRVRQEIGESDGHRNGRRIDVTEAFLVRSLDEIAGVLEFNRQEEGRRSIDASHFATLSVRSARVDVVLPESETRR